jgi:hypothetical protein
VNRIDNRSILLAAAQAVLKARKQSYKLRGSRNGFPYFKSFSSRRLSRRGNTRRSSTGRIPWSRLSRQPVMWKHSRRPVVIKISDTAIRAVTALQGYDSSKHSGIIAYYNQQCNDNSVPWSSSGKNKYGKYYSICNISFYIT